MIYKKNKYKLYEIHYKKLILYSVIILYIIGILSGSYFAFKNASNLSFVQKVTVTENLIQSGKTGNLGLYVQYMIRDLLLIALIFILKYSGALKGVCVTIPFILAVQNSSIYASVISSNIVSIYNMIIYCIIKDTTISILIILLTTQTIIEIITNKYDKKADVKKVIRYNLSVLFVYVINFSVNYMIL